VEENKAELNGRKWLLRKSKDGNTLKNLFNSQAEKKE
jgi:hypothetical protein